MKIILYVLMVAAAALNTYHPKKQAAPAQAAKHVTTDTTGSNAVAFNSSGTSFASAQTN